MTTEKVNLMLNFKRNRWFTPALAILAILVIAFGSYQGMLETNTINSSSISTPLQRLYQKAETSISQSALGPMATSMAKTGSITSISGSVYRATVASLLGPYGYLANQIDDQKVHDIELFAASGGRNAHLNPFLGVPAGIIGIGGVVALTLVCAVGGVETLGIACLVALAIIGVAIVIAALICPISNLFGSSWGCSPVGAAGAAADGEAQQIVSGFGEAANVQAIAIYNLLQVYNDTEEAMAYEAAAAALNQLPNATFNGPLALLQGGVAQQVGSIFYGDTETMASLYASLLYNFNYYEGSANTLGQYCPVVFNSGGAAPAVPGGDSTSTGFPQCPISFSGALSLARGQMFGAAGTIATSDLGTSLGYACGPEWFIQSGSSITIPAKTTVGWNLTLIPIVDNSTASPVPWINISVPAESGGWLENYTFTSGLGGGNGMGYWLCTNSGANVPVSLALYLSYAMPLGATANGYNEPPSVVWENPSGTLPANTIGSSGAVYALLFNPAGVNIGANAHTIYCGTGTGAINYIAYPFGLNTNTTYNCNSPPNDFNGAENVEGAQYNIAKYLVAIMNYAQSQASVYWGYLHNLLGYTNKSQVPLRCIIPSPAELLPGNIPIKNLETMNTTQLLAVYIKELQALGLTFGANSTLNSTTICGKHPKWDPGNTTFGWGTYALGYIYVPGSGVRNSNGTALQKFSTPTTWNISGEFYISPTLASLANIPVNTTFSLPELNPVTFFVQPFLKTNASNRASLYVNVTGPSWCLDPTRTGCGTNPAYSFVTGYTEGNSSAGAGLTGSVYPNHIDTGASTKTAVFITGCYVATNGSSSINPVYTFSNTCLFSEQRINNTGWSCDGNVLYSGGVAIGSCGSGGGPVLVAGNACSILFISTIDTAFQSFIGEPWACLLTWIVVVVVVLLIIWAIVVIVRRSGNGRNTLGGNMRST